MAISPPGAAATMSHRQSIGIHPLVLAGLAAVVGLPLLVVGAMAVGDGAPASAAVGFVAGAFALLAVFLCVLLPNRIEIADGQLHLRAGLARYRVALADLDPNTLRAVDPARQPDLTPRRRTFGTSIPGVIDAGWFRLRDGRKAFVLSNRRERLTAIDAPNGVVLLIALDQPDTLRRAIVAARPRAHA
jgi:hypothetical protein